MQDLDAVPFPVLPEPELPRLDRPWSMLITGIGGTGVVTIGHLLGMAAHMEGKGAALIDMVGISQKNGAVVTHLKIGARPEDIAAVRVARGQADLISAAISSPAPPSASLPPPRAAAAHAVVNSHEVMPAHFTHDADFDVHGAALALRVSAAVKPGGLHAIDATEIATRLLGDSIAANLFTLGFAWQKGLIPVSEQAIADAVRLNGVGVKMNLAAFLWGPPRRGGRGRGSRGDRHAPHRKPEGLAEIVARRAAFLTDYQNAAYAESYRSFVEKVRQRSEPLAAAVAVNLFKLMAYKDEYEVARLHSDGRFAAEIARQFKGDYTLTFHLAPPMLGAAGWQRQAGEIQFRPLDDDGVRPACEVQGAARNRLRHLRPYGRAPDGTSAHCRLSRHHRGPAAIPGTLQPRGAVEIASLPAMIRGFGHVKEASVAKARLREAELRRQFSALSRNSRRRPSDQLRGCRRPITLAAMRAAVKAAVPRGSRRGMNSTIVNPAMRALAATPATRSVTCV